MNLWETIKGAFRGTEETMPEENDQIEITEEELDRLALARVVEKGMQIPSQPQTQESKPEQIPGYDIAMPYGYDNMDFEEKQRYIVNETRKQAIAEAQKATKSEIETANAALLKELQDLKGALSGTLAPVMKQQVVEKVALNCSEEARPFIVKALEEAEERFKKGPITRLDENEAWLVANRAEVLLNASRQSVAPTVVYSETAAVPESGANKQALAWLNNMKQIAPTVEFTYQEALDAIKEDSRGV